MQESLDASLVHIRTPEGRVGGAGFLVGEQQILTCAHVVSQALGLVNAPLRWQGRYCQPETARSAVGRSRGGSFCPSRGCVGASLSRLRLSQRQRGYRSELVLPTPR